jgi:replicative DNA helicase
MNTSTQNNSLYSVEAEQALLGALLINPEVYHEVADGLAADDFYIHRHRFVWQAIASLIEKYQPVDFLTLNEELDSQGRLAEIGGPAFLTSLINGTPTSLHAQAYANIILEYAIRRKFLEAAHTIAQAAYQQEQSLEAVIETAEKSVFQASQRGFNHTIQPFEDLIDNAYDRAEQLSQVSGVSGIPTGFPELDRLTDGFLPSDLIVLAGRPGMGKTGFALGVAYRAAKRHGKHVAIFTLEMNSDQLVFRLLTQELSIDSQRLRAGRMSKEEWFEFRAAKVGFAKLQIYLDDTPALTPAQLRSRCRKLRREVGLDLVVIDYLQLMAGGERFENRVMEVGHISRQLKLLARELNVPILAAAQLSRAVEQRQDKRPVLADLRESGNIEQDADLVMFLYRSDIYSETDRSQAELILAKQRSGPTGIVDLCFRPSYARFENPGQP